MTTPQPKAHPQEIVIRPALMRFAEYMELVLRKNDNKKSWENCTYEYLFNGIERETKELRECFWYPDSRSDFMALGDDFMVVGRLTEEQVLTECADVANFAMMVFDVLMQREYGNGCASHTTSAQERKPCFSCKIPKSNKDGSCCLDVTNCTDIWNWEKENTLAGKVLTLLVDLKKETTEDGNDFYDGYIDDAIALLQAGRK